MSKKIQISRVESTQDFSIKGLEKSSGIFSTILEETGGKTGKNANSNNIYCKTNPTEAVFNAIRVHDENYEVDIDTSALKGSKQTATTHSSQQKEDVSKGKVNTISITEGKGVFYVNGLQKNKDGEPSPWHNSIAKEYGGTTQDGKAVLNSAGNLTVKENPSAFFEDEKVKAVLDKKDIKFEGVGSATQAPQSQSEEVALSVEERVNKKSGESFLVLVGTKEEDTALREHIKAKYDAKYNANFHSWTLTNADVGSKLSVTKDILDVYLGKKEGIKKEKSVDSSNAKKEEAAKPETAKAHTISVVEGKGVFYVNGLKNNKEGKPSKWHNEIAGAFDGKINKQGNLTCNLNPTPFFETSGVQEILGKKGINFEGIKDSVKKKDESLEVVGYEMQVTPSSNGGVHVNCMALKDIPELLKNFKETFNPGSFKDAFDKEKGWEIDANERQVKTWMTNVGEKIIQDVCMQDAQEEAREETMRTRDYEASVS